jgi:hypothetical protein
MLKNIPDSILQPDKMAEVFVDIHLAEASALALKTDSVHIDDLLNAYYPAILQHHNITRQQLEHSYTYYTVNPLIMDYVYKKVIDALNLAEKGPSAMRDSTLKTNEKK